MTIKTYNVPNILHLVHLNGGEFPLYVYLNFLAAMENIKPNKTLFHFTIEPRGQFWKKLLNLPTFIPLKYQEPVQIHGIIPDKQDWAHKSDIIRLDALRKYGGIYIDTDVLVLRSFDYFRQFPFTMGNWRTEELSIVLCNAVIISAANSSFLQRWYSGYKEADFSCWDCQSVVLPTEMARKNRSGMFFLRISKIVFLI